MEFKKRSRAASGQPHACLGGSITRHEVGSEGRASTKTSVIPTTPRTQIRMTNTPSNSQTKVIGNETPFNPSFQLPERSLMVNRVASAQPLS